MPPEPSCAFLGLISLWTFWALLALCVQDGHVL